MFKIYSIEETFNEKNDRTVIFNLLRSIIYVKIKNNKIYIIQQARWNDFYNETIASIEQEKLLCEKTQVDWLVREHYDELLKNESIDKIISLYSKPENCVDKIWVENKKTAILKVEYIREMLKKEYREHREYHAKMFEEYHSRYDECEMNKYLKGIQNVRFYLCNDNIVDIAFSKTHVYQTSSSPSVTSHEISEIQYFCNKYFFKFINGIDIKEIINDADSDSLNIVNNGAHFQKKKLLT